MSPDSVPSTSQESRRSMAAFVARSSTTTRMSPFVKPKRFRSMSRIRATSFTEPRRRGTVLS
jgi:hypothetical protein